MGRIYHFIASFIDIRRSIKARIFLSFSTLTIIITVIISIYWYQRIVQSTTNTIVDNMKNIVNSSLAQIDNAYQDTKLMHYMILYESNCMDY
jgi:hypothetical protein